jgi:NAD(P)-dependent dehydrogenase (short-subunit alcohol dehydrogenase family)
MTVTEQLAGKTAIVTGASRGIGLAIVRSLTDAGARVVGSARTATRELADGAAVVVTADLATPDGSAEQKALELVGDIDILVNCAGGGSPDDFRDFFGYDDEIWRKTFELNL